MGTPYQITGHTFLLLEGSEYAPINLRGNVDLNYIFSDFNVFYLGVGEPAVLWTNPPEGMPTSMTFSEWQSRGKDLHSKNFDPTDPEIAANIADYHAKDLIVLPPLIVSPCCARFLMGDPNLFMQHIASYGVLGWSDAMLYGSAVTQTFCGECGRDGLLLENP